IVEIETDLKITGKVAQFGRGVLQDVSAKLIGQFAECLATTVLTGGAGAASATPAESLGAAEAAGARTEPAAVGASPTSGEASASTREAPRAAAPRPTPDAVDLGEVAGAAVAKRVVPVIAALVLLIVLWRM